jgi:para-aminobenzoate synthetase component 1
VLKFFRVLTGKKPLKNIESADRLVAALLVLSENEKICLLDSCGSPHLGAHFLIAGINPLETHEIINRNADETLRFLDEKISDPNVYSIFTLSYEFGLKLENIEPREKSFHTFAEPDVFLAVFDCLVIHDYDTRETFLIGKEKRFAEIEEKLETAFPKTDAESFPPNKCVSVVSNFSKTEYLRAVDQIKEFIRQGDTYQINLTQQIRVELPENSTPQQIFHHLRTNNPAPFAAFLQRNDSTVVSASPERFFRVRDRNISTSPIKGTRPRGKTQKDDEELKNELLDSVKDRAENVMIVDLLRNDLGRICEFGSVSVRKLCDLETHPTVFHLVSTIDGDLRRDAKFSDIIRAVFPCGSITGAPKISTMRIIDRLETAPRGLSMGAIGYSIQNSLSKTLHSQLSTLNSLDLSVAIRTMTICGRTAVFNVGGGIVIDSDDESEYAETLVKAGALLDALLRAKIINLPHEREQFFLFGV